MPPLVTSSPGQADGSIQSNGGDTAADVGPLRTMGRRDRGDDLVAYHVYYGALPQTRRLLYDPKGKKPSSQGHASPGPHTFFDPQRFHPHCQQQQGCGYHGLSQGQAAYSPDECNWQYSQPMADHDQFDSHGLKTATFAESIKGEAVEPLTLALPLPDQDAVATSSSRPSPLSKVFSLTRRLLPGSRGDRPDRDETIGDRPHDGSFEEIDEEGGEHLDDEESVEFEYDREEEEEEATASLQGDAAAEKCFPQRSMGDAHHYRMGSPGCGVENRPSRNSAAAFPAVTSSREITNTTENYHSGGFSFESRSHSGQICRSGVFPTVSTSQGVADNYPFQNGAAAFRMVSSSRESAEEVRMFDLSDISPGPANGGDAAGGFVPQDSPPAFPSAEKTRAFDPSGVSIAVDAPVAVAAIKVFGPSDVVPIEGIPPLAADRAASVASDADDDIAEPFFVGRSLMEMGMCEREAEAFLSSIRKDDTFSGTRGDLAQDSAVQGCFNGSTFGDGAGSSADATAAADDDDDDDIAESFFGRPLMEMESCEREADTMLPSIRTDGNTRGHIAQYPAAAEGGFKFTHLFPSIGRENTNIIGDHTSKISHGDAPGAADDIAEAFFGRPLMEMESCEKETNPVGGQGTQESAAVQGFVGSCYVVIDNDADTSAEIAESFFGRPLMGMDSREKEAGTLLPSTHGDGKLKGLVVQDRGATRAFFKIPPPKSVGGGVMGSYGDRNSTRVTKLAPVAAPTSAPLQPDAPGPVTQEGYVRQLGRFLWQSVRTVFTFSARAPGESATSSLLDMGV